MPWKIVQRGGAYLVVKKDGSKVVGSHGSRREALAQLRALYASERKR